MLFKLPTSRWNMILHANRNDRKVEVVMHISDKIDFKAKFIKKDKDTIKEKDKYYIITFICGI